MLLRLRNALALVLCMVPALPAGVLGQTPAHRREKTTIGDRRTAVDGVTKGWLVFYPYPTDEPSQQWRTIAGTLVIMRHGKVIRTIKADTSFWNWGFWDDGRQVAYEVGPLHGITECALKEVNSGRVLASFHGDCRDKPEDAPAWVKSLQ